jgi:hypothetical protein
MLLDTAILSAEGYGIDLVCRATRSGRPDAPAKPLLHQVAVGEGIDRVLADKPGRFLDRGPVRVGVPEQPAVGAARDKDHPLLFIGHFGEGRAARADIGVGGDQNLRILAHLESGGADHLQVDLVDAGDKVVDDVERGGRGSRVAGSEDEPVGIGAARHGVTAEPALELVVSRTGRQDVVADIAAQRVHRVVAEDPVVEIVAVGIGGGRRIDGQIFDIAFVGELPASRGNDLVAPRPFRCRG